MAGLPQGLTGPEEYCRGRAAPPGSSLYYATLFEPVASRQRLYPVFALHYEITDALTASPDPGVIRLKLQWWVEEIDRLLRREPRHPVTTRLLSLVPEPEPLRPGLQGYLSLVDSLLGRPDFRDVPEWFARLSGGFGRIWQLAADIDGRQPAGDRQAGHGGAALVLELLQNTPMLSARGHTLLPDTLLMEHALSTGDLIPGTDAPAANRAFGELVREIQHRLDEAYRQDRRSGMPAYPLIFNRLAAATCAEIQRDGNRLLRHRIALTPLRKLWIAWRTKVAVS